MHGNAWAWRRAEPVIWTLDHDLQCEDGQVLHAGTVVAFGDTWPRPSLLSRIRRVLRLR